MQNNINIHEALTKSMVQFTLTSPDSNSVINSTILVFTAYNMGSLSFTFNHESSRNLCPVDV